MWQKYELVKHRQGRFYSPPSHLSLVNVFAAAAKFSKGDFISYY